MEYLDLLLNEGKKYLKGAMPGGSLNPEWTPERLKKAGSTALDFVPVVGGIKGAKEEWEAGNPGWAAFNAATVPIDLMSFGAGGAAMKAGAAALGAIPAGVFKAHKPLKPNPEVGTRFKREFLGGLADKTVRKIEDLYGSSLSLMPWDSTSRNWRIDSISDERLANPIVTHGGQDYARDLDHISRGVAGASNLGIAKRIAARDDVARRENIAAGGNGSIIHLPVTMGDGGENFSVMPTNALLGLLDARELPSKDVERLNSMIREFTPPGSKIKTPFAGFSGLMEPAGREQILTGDGIASTAGELRKAIVNRLSTVEAQKTIGYNHPDLVAALTDPSLAGVKKGYAGNTLIRVGDEGMSVMPGSNPTYSHDFTGQYFGTLGHSIPAEVLMPKTFERLSGEFANRKSDLRTMTLGAMEKRGSGFSELVDQRVVDNVNEWLEQQRNLGLLSDR